MTAPGEIGLLLCGDVMLGRGVDQVLPHPGDPWLQEHRRNIKDARVFVELAVQKHGALPQHRDAGYVWGEALAAFDAFGADLRLINLETAATARGEPWPGKAIHYRMNPRNADVLTRAGIDFCALANNHVLDWGHEGLEDTLAALDGAGIRHAGAGHNRRQAVTPAILEVPGKGRVIVLSLATPSSGVPEGWAAGPDTPGVNRIGLNAEWVDTIRASLPKSRQAGDIVVVSIHWGDNFGYVGADAQAAFARRLIDEAGVDLIHGHSSHHVKGIEVYKGRPILYGCGDFITDYEGIPKRPERAHYASELGMAVHARLACDSGRLIALQILPTRLRRLQVCRAGAKDAARLAAILNTQGDKLGTQVSEHNGLLTLQWEDG